MYYSGLKKTKIFIAIANGARPEISKWNFRPMSSSATITDLEAILSESLNLCIPDSEQSQAITGPYRIA